MNITVENKRKTPIYLDMESYGYSGEIYKMKLEKYENNSWNPTEYQFSTTIRCSPGQGPAIGCVEVKGGKKLERTKSLSYWECVGEFNPETGETPHSKSDELPPGRYRLKVKVGEVCWRTEVITEREAPVSVYSNEFRIK